MKNSYLTRKLYTWPRNVKSNHEMRGFTFDTAVTKTYLKELLQEALKHGCAYCGSELSFEKEYSANYPTLDVIDPWQRFLTRENIKVICNRCNVLKRNMDHNEFMHKLEAGILVIS